MRGREGKKAGKETGRKRETGRRERKGEIKSAKGGRIEHKEDNRRKKEVEKIRNRRQKVKEREM